MAKRVSFIIPDAEYAQLSKGNRPDYVAKEMVRSALYRERQRRIAEAFKRRQRSERIAPNREAGFDR